MYRYQILLLCMVGLVADAATDTDGPQSPCHQFYPNIPGDTLLENEKIVVQRFNIAPGQWEGVHRHPPNQLYIMLNGGEWTVRYGDKRETSYSTEGEIGWSDTGLGLDADHESQNSGDEAIDLIWVAVKPGCMADT